MISLNNREQATAIYALLIALVFALLSFYDTDAETYLFPRIIAIALLILSLAHFISNLSVKTEIDNYASDHRYIRDLLPGLIVGLVFILVLETIGFYTSSFFTFLALLSLYGKRRALDPKALAKKVMVSLAFMAILYLLFWVGLQVRTPAGWFF